jgi:hypothetical protein
MITLGKTMLPHATVVILAVLLPASDGGAGDAEFVAACLEEGERGGDANKLLDKELGINRAASCNCTAKEARSTLTRDSYRVMMLEMQGKGHEATEISSKMNETEQISFFNAMEAIYKKCVGGPR